MGKSSTFGHERQGPFNIQDDEDEIDIRALIQQLFAQWLIISIIVALGTIGAIIFAFVQTKIYQIEVVASLPSLEQIEPLNRNGVKSYSPEKTFAQYFQNLVSADLLRKYFVQQSFYKVVTPNKDDHIYAAEEINQIFLGFQKSVQISKVRPDYLELAKNEKTPLNNVSFILQSTFPHESANFLNGYIKYIQTQTLSQLTSEQATLKRIEQEKLREEIRALTEQARIAREARVIRLIEENKMQTAQLEDQIHTLVAQAQFEKKARIAYLEEALNIAQELGVEKPLLLNDYTNKDIARGNIGISTISNEGKDPLYYLMGSKFLSAKIKQLQHRQNDEYSIPKIGELRRELALAKQNREIETLAKRENDEPFIDELPAIQNRLKQLEHTSLKFDGTKLFKLEQAAFAPSNPIKPNKKLIVSGGCLLSIILALLVALVRGVLFPREQEQSTDDGAPIPATVPIDLMKKSQVANSQALSAAAKTQEKDFGQT